MRITRIQFGLIGLALILAGTIAQGQATGFTYQGRLNTSGSPASGIYEMQFQLFDSANGGAQVGATITDSSVAIANGVFTTTLDFGASFDGSPRYVEIGVRPGGSSGSFTVLSPRQAINSVPYSVRSVTAGASDALSASCVNCVTSGQIQSIDGTQITGTLPIITIPTGSENYIQNASVPRGTSKIAGQPAASLNIGGNATVGSMDVNGPVSLAAVAEPAAAPAGQGRIYFDSATNKVKVSENGSAFVNLVGATGVSGSGTPGSIPLFTAGTTLGSSLISQSGGSVFLPSAVSLAATASGNNIAFGSPNSGTGMTISGPTTRADVRLDGTTLRLNVGPAGTGPPVNGIGIDSNGTVQLPSGVSLAATASGNNVAFGSPNSETGMTISGTSGRADLRYDGTLKLLNGPGGIPPATNGIAIDTAGNVGIGTTTPIAKLDVESSQPGKSAVFGKETGANGIGTYGEATAANGVGVFARNLNGVALFADGSVNTNGIAVQSRDKGGFVKAMVQIHYDGEIPTFIRCYNGVAGLSAGQCGFNYDHYIDSFGLHTLLNFGFTVNDRFISSTGTGINVQTVWAFPSSNTVDILSRANSGSSTASDVYIFVF